MEAAASQTYGSPFQPHKEKYVLVNHNYVIKSPNHYYEIRKQKYDIKSQNYRSSL